jgi:tripartite-type tricarboxylate transporter receptor subunit TctC
MNRKGEFLRLAAVLIGIWAWTPAAHGQGDFYKGKTITVYIGTTPGALYDQWSRLLAQYMPKHIPGKTGHDLAKHAGRGPQNCGQLCL